MGPGPARAALASLLLGTAACAPPFAEIIEQNRTALLAQQPPVSWSAWVNHGLMGAVVTGAPDGQPVVFVHGSPGSWDANAHLLNDPELRVKNRLIGYDRLGYGGSQPGKMEPSLGVQGDALAGLLDALGVRRPVILVGHSMGGPTIARFAMDHPDRVAGLVFVAASVNPELETWRWYNRAASWRLAKGLLPTYWITSNEEIRLLKGELEAMLPLWPNIQAPCAIVHGTDDGLVPVGNVAFLEAHLQGRPLHEQVIPGESHAILWDRPDLIREAIAWIEAGPNRGP